MKPSTILSLKSMVLFSTAVLSAAIALQYYFSAADLCEAASVLYNGVASWLKPPYLYLLINFIIVTILASSKLGSNNTDSDSDSAAPPPLLHPQSTRVLSPLTPNTSSKDLDGMVFNLAAAGYNNHGGVVPAGEENKTAAFLVRDAMGNKENDYPYARNNKEEYPLTTKLHREYYVSGDAKPPARARFGHRRNVKSSPEGAKATTALGVSKPKRQDTLESTWKTITEGRSIPITRHLKKSDTWERDSRQSQYKTPPQKAKISKSETFNDRSITSPSSSSISSGGGSGKIRREPSPGQDELNRRVEAFIKKFNEEMRLQRQESLNQYRDMFSRGSY